MKTILTILASAAMMLGSALADAAAKTTYVLGMTGVTWAGCKKHVREAFTKLKGVDAASIKIESDGSGGQKVTFASTEAKITKDEAVKSLGDQASTYIVKTLATEGEKKEGKKEEKKEGKKDS